MKVKVNENLTSLFNFIKEYRGVLSWFELVQWAIDYDMYQELYIHNMIISKLVDEHNKVEIYKLKKKDEK